MAQVAGSIPAAIVLFACKLGTMAANNRQALLPVPALFAGERVFVIFARARRAAGTLRFCECDGSKLAFHGDGGAHHFLGG